MTRWIARITDLLAVLAAVFAMVGTTPLGGWIRAEVRQAMGRPPERQALARWFTTGARASDPPAGVAVRLDVVAAHPREDAPESRVATEVGLRPSLARAVLVMAADGRADAAGQLAVRVPPSARPALDRARLALPAPGSGGESRVLIEAVARLAPALGSEDAAVAALIAGPSDVERAIARARAAGERDPAKWEAFAGYLPRAERRPTTSFVRGALALSTAYELEPPLARIDRVSSGFGPRVHPVLGTRRMHTGIDLPVPSGTPILAVGPGVVTHAGEDSVNGKFVRIDHGHGLTSAYCHASELSAAKHDRVERAQRIAASGNTGRSTGPHLHFQLEIDRVPVDPALFLRALAAE